MIEVSSLRLFFLINLVAFIFCLQPAEKYGFVNDFSQNIKEKEFESIHDIVRRHIPPTGASSTSVIPPAAENPPTIFAPHIAPPGSPTGNPSGLLSTARHPSSTRRPQLTTMPARTNITEDKHVYYKPVYHRYSKGLWFNIKEGGTPKLHEELSKNIQYSDTIKISFNFPYYGHMINKVTITNKGYVFLGDVVHKFNTSEQYVAPLMADFRPDENTKIHYVDTGDRFTVEWAHLRFQDKKVGEFSFQCSIFKNGTFVFAYKDIPVPVSELQTSSLPVRVGLSDSYRLRYIRHGFFYINRRFYTSIVFNVYFKYNTVDLPMSYVKSGSAFVITPLPNCVMFNSCDSCVSSNTTFSCAWCPKLQRCSDGIDRHRHDWIIYGCTQNNKTTCPLKISETEKPIKETDTPREKGKANKTLEIKHHEESNTTFKGQEKGNNTHDKPDTPDTPDTLDKQGKNNKTSEIQKNGTKIFDSNKPTKSSESTKSEGLDSTGRKEATDKTKSKQQRSGIGGVSIFVIVFILGIVSVVICWVLYAYHHPQSRSGRFLIKHRNPKKWFRNSNDDNQPGGGTVRFQTRSHEQRNA